MKPDSTRMGFSVFLGSETTARLEKRAPTMRRERSRALWGRQRRDERNRRWISCGGAKNEIKTNCTPEKTTLGLQRLVLIAHSNLQSICQIQVFTLNQHDVCPIHQTFIAIPDFSQGVGGRSGRDVGTSCFENAKKHTTCLL
ncbi:hypothetical protein TNCV_3426701 [Trichonephila clavipes]|nr:hypothetical protein TNCV_3426701 [Trichonephila clavipes]